MNICDRLYVSTVAEDARDTAIEFGLGLELAEFCTAMNMDAPNPALPAEFNGFPYWDAVAKKNAAGIANRTFHAPFNELCPAAIDPRALEVARGRFLQAAALAAGYGAKKMVVHSGFVPLVYFKDYFVERSTEFWRELLADIPAELALALENVLESEPCLTTEIVRRVNSPRLRLCLDIGHANTIVSATPVLSWIDTMAPYLGHVHLHNNYREYDHHNPLGNGQIDMDAAMARLTSVCDTDCTFVIESLDARSSALWLRERGYIQKREG
ncbi:MAG: sugar phosphate isomerase/epimerase [Oscillospiraceae bacterium]|jgi:sugar phosphate isomerase/epimerase|nr:sugar phosphate isomerase/epimerase [Oscillospiraceae bacterium]